MCVVIVYDFLQTLDKMREEARHFLHFVPVKEPRSEKIDILSKDDEIAGFDNSKFIFTDITFDATDQVCLSVIVFYLLLPSLSVYFILSYIGSYCCCS